MQSHEPEKRRILVLENEPVIGQLCQRVLGSQGFDVELVAGVDCAAHRMCDRYYDLCIKDWQMPGIDGIQLYSSPNNEAPGAGVDATLGTGDVSYTGHGPPSGVPEKVYLQKPFTPRELIAAVEMALN